MWNLGYNEQKGGAREDSWSLAEERPDARRWGCNSGHNIVCLPGADADVPLVMLSCFISCCCDVFHTK